MYIVDFGTEMSLEDAALYEAPFEYVSEHVRPMREKNNRKAYRERWWIHMEPRPAMRRAFTDLTRFIGTSSVSKHRIFAWLDSSTLPDHALIVFARDDDYFFGVLHSRTHELWAMRMGTFLEGRPRYTPTTCFETFPFPEPNEERLAKISAAAKHLDELRRNWLNPEGLDEAELKKRTLTNLYNARPTRLANAHAALDRAVFSAYGWPEGIGGDPEEPPRAQPGAASLKGSCQARGGLLAAVVASHRAAGGSWPPEGRSDIIRKDDCRNRY